MVRLICTINKVCELRSSGENATTIGLNSEFSCRRHVPMLDRGSKCSSRSSPALRNDSACRGTVVNDMERRPCRDVVMKPVLCCVSRPRHSPAD
jgi:hypothetical protein